MRAILRSKNALTAGGSSPGGSSDGPEGGLSAAAAFSGEGGASASGGLRRSSGGALGESGTPCKADAAAARPHALLPVPVPLWEWSRPCKSARSSRDYKEPLGGEPAGALGAGGEADPASPPAAAAAVVDMPAESRLRAAPVSLQLPLPWPGSGGAVVSHEGLQDIPANHAWMELDSEDPNGVQESSQSASDGGAAAATRPGQAWGLPDSRPGGVPATDGHAVQSGHWGAAAGDADGEAGDRDSAAVDAAQGSESSTAGARTVEAAAFAAAVDVPWGELAADVVASIAMKLPQAAPQAQTMASVCRGWRAAILEHSPLLRRLTFGLDPSHPLRSKAPAAASTSAGIGTERSGTQDDSGAAATGPSATGSASVLLAAGASGQHAKLSEEETERCAMEAAVTRQYAAGAFVLPSGSGRQQGSRETAQGSCCAGAEGVAPRRPAAALPRILVAAAHASNPSAQLVLAQLLEGWGEASCALRWWRKLAAGGDTLGMFKLGMASYDGSHGMQPDPETAHMWLGRTVRQVLRVDSLAAIQLDDRRTCLEGEQGPHPPGDGAPASQSPPAPQPGQQQQGTAAEGWRMQGGGQPAGRLAAQVRCLDPMLLRMLGWSAIVLGYLEFDGVAGPSAWGMGDRSAAVRMFRLAEVCGVAEASATLGWLFNTGQY